MKVILLALVLSLTPALGADILFSNRVATFTNLEGHAFIDVTLVKADLDGLIWRENASGGRVCFTNLTPALLQQLGIPTNRIQIAAERASRKATADAASRARSAVAAAAAERARTASLLRMETNQEATARSNRLAVSAQAIAELEAQIEAARIRMRRAQAIAHDNNKAGGQRIYIKETKRVEIEEAAQRLAKMKADYARQLASHGKD